MNFNYFILLSCVSVYQALASIEVNKCSCRIQCDCPQRPINNDCKSEQSEESSATSKTTPKISSTKAPTKQNTCIELGQS